MRSRVWRELGTHGITDSDPSTWPAGRIGNSVSKALQGDRCFASFWSDDVVNAIDGLLGASHWARPEAVEILLNFPEPNSPLRQLDPFHSDFAMDVSSEPLFAVNVFACIGAVAPRSGGTLVVRNSHRVVQRYLDVLPPGFPRNRAAAQFDADHPWLRALSGLIGATHDCDGILVCVDELTGEPGDVVITHPWALHAGISSQGAAPRIMLRHRVFRRAV